ncbi:MAG: HD domain-containing protein, partial [Caldilineaceae bacterium]|nr:HD domain-containing protein [Caldilineaceae bacterium]
MSTLEIALQLAAKNHAGQTDKAGQPYILHPIRVMLAVQGESARIAAVLHDVVEDTAVTFADLQAAGFSDEIVDTVRALTKSPGERRLEAATRAASHPIARVVKLADV